MGVNKTRTDLGVSIDVFNDLGWNFKMIEVGNRVLLVQDRGWDTVKVEHYNKDNGKRIKGQRHNLKAGETSKGRFVNYNRQRLYI